MAFGYFMNMEKLALLISEKHISYMTDEVYDSEYSSDYIIDEEKLTNNLENGFVVITQLNCYIESFLNTIIYACMDYTGEALLKCSIQEKMDLIFMYYKKDWSGIKGKNCWGIYMKTTRVRNAMIHYKISYIGESTVIPNFEIGKEKVANFFTKQNMIDLKNAHIELAKLITNALELTLFEEIDIIACNGRDELVNYVYDARKTDVDEDRFK